MIGHEVARSNGLGPHLAPVGAAVVGTSAGRVRGAVYQGVYSFKGIPYGADTGGANRFQPPKPVQWSGVLDTYDYGPSAPQDHGPASPVPHMAWMGETCRQSENCLVLNVFTASLDDTDRLPVMVWFHGGGFMVGTASAAGTDGSNLARRGVVLVSLNHRLNLFGHLYLGERETGKFADSGNVGMLDVVAALRWVKDNIECFGGDPDNVTIFGASGGGSKVGILMAIPRAQGLFHRAIVQSASSMLRVATLEDAERNTHYFLRELNLNQSNFESLSETPAERLLEARRNAVIAAGKVDNYRPVADGRSLPVHPFDGAASDVSAQVPLMLGWCETEQRLRFSLSPVEFQQSEEQARARVAAFLGISLPEAETLIDVYRSGRPMETPGDIMALIYGDHRYRRTVTRAAELKSQRCGAPVYLYMVSWKTPVLGGLLRSPHSLCMPFVFSNVDLAAGLVGTAADRYLLQEEMSGAWVKFAQSGNPNYQWLPTWKPYSAAERSTMVFDRSTRLIKDPAPEERIALENCPSYAPAETEGGRRH